MKDFIIRQLARPVVTRLGTGVAMFLTGTLAVEPETANQVAIGVAAAGGIILDFITRRWWGD